MIRHIFVSAFKACLLFPVFALCGLGMQAQTPMVQVPFATNVLGVPTSTYNSATAGPACTNGLTASGDGCPGTQSPLFYPYSVAVDTAGDLVTASAAGTQGVTALYEGGSTMAALISGAKPGVTPTVGSAYFLNAGTALLTPVGGVYYCNGASGTVALDKYQNGCPATYAYFQSRAVTMDPEGSIFIGEYEPFQSVRVIYGGGVRAANLIKAFNPTVTPQIGFIYALSTPDGAVANNAIDFVSIRGIAIQPVNATTENIFVADNGGSTTETGIATTTSGNQIKEFFCPTGTAGCNTVAPVVNGNKTTLVGWVTYILGVATASPTTADGDGGPVSAASVTTPYCLQVDKYGNLYIGDLGDLRIRVVYVGGTTPPLYVEGLNSNAYVATPVVGDIYTVVGGPTATPLSPAQANLVPTSATNFGLDAAGDLYFTKSISLLWEENVQTGLTINVGWQAASAVTYSSNASPGAGAGCNGTAVGSVTGPAMTDAYADGCPATQITDALPDWTPIVFDTAGNFYMPDGRNSSGATAIVRKYTFGNQFGSVAVGSSATTSFAFTPSINQGGTTYTPVLSLSSPDYIDAGGDICTTTTSGTYKTQTCVYNITFKPTRAGARPGTLTLTQGTTVLVSIALGGTGTGSQASLDPATQVTIGTGLVPAGVALDPAGNAYIADTTTGNVYKSTSGGVPVSFATGLKTPAQVAVSGAGAVYVADKGNSRVASVASAGGAVTSFLPLGTATTFTLTTPGLPSTATAGATLSAPQGVAVDLSGNVYVADTGNNRVIEVVTPQGGAGAVNVLLGFTGLSAPKGIAVDANGNVFVADSGNARIVELNAAGVQTTVSVSTGLATPVGVAVDAAGDLYVADTGDQDVVLIPAGSTTTTALLGSLNGLAGLAVDTTGDVFIANSTSAGLVELNRTAIALAYPLTNVGSSSTQTITLSDTGNATLTTGTPLDSGTDATDFSVAGATTSGCTANGSVAPRGSCFLAAVFMPKTIGSFTDTVTFPSSSAVNAPTAVLSGSGAKLTATTTALTYATSAPITPTGGLPIAGTAFNLTDTITLASNVGTPTGTVTFTVDGTPQKPVTIAVGTAITASLSLTLTAGPHTILAAYSGDANYAGSQASVSVTAVTPQTTTIKMSYSLGTPTGNTINTVLTATLSAPSTTAAFSGSVIFSVDGVAQTATTVSAAGIATITVPLSAGSHTVAASYAGTSYYTSISGSETFTVVTGTSSVSLSVSPTGTITFGGPVTFTAATTLGNSTATPTGSIIFTINGVAQTPVAYASSATLTLPLLTPGTYTVSASYTGDSNYASAQSAQSVVVNVVQAASTTGLQVLPAVTVTSNNGINTVNATLTLTATVGQAFASTYPGGTVTFLSGGTALGVPVKLVSGSASYTISAGTLSTLTSFVFTASYSGDTNYLPSTIAPGSSFTIGLQSTSLTVPQNSIVTDEIGLLALGGYTGTVTLSCTGLPANTACAFSPTSTSFTASNNAAAQAVQLQLYTNATPLATGTAQIARKNGSLWLASNLGLFACLGLSWKRRRRLAHLLLSMVLLTTVLGVSSCGSSTANNTLYQTPTGTYTIGVTATDGKITSTTNVTVTVIANSAAARPS